MIWLNTVPESVQTAKQNAASAVRNRIPARVDVMIWTVMNMRRSVKNMRLIDADKIDFNEVFVGASEFAQDTRNAAQMLIDEQPTAFDLDMVVQQLEKRSTLSRPVGWTKSYEIVTLDDAIEIVKGGGAK